MSEHTDRAGPHEGRPLGHLVVVPQGPFRRTEAGLRTTSPRLAEIEALAPWFERITVCARVEEAPGSRGEAIRDPRVSVRPLPSYLGPRGFLRRAPHYRRLLAESFAGADLVLVILPGLVGALASALAQRRGVPVFHKVVGSWGDVFAARRRHGAARLAVPLLRPLARALVRRLVRDTLCFFPGGTPDRAPPPHHHACTAVSIAAADRLEAARPEPATGTPWRVLSVGRLSREKGLEDLLDAIARVDGPATLDVVGDGELRASLEARARALGLAERVRFHGYVSRGAPLWERFAAADVFVLASLEDLQPRVLLEAMARRVPLVATRVGRVDSLVAHERNGLLIEPGRPAAIAAAIERLRDDRALRERLVTAGARRAAEHSLEQESARMMRIVRAHFA
ncbi:MAG: glycosyltransferase [Myxococcota bacterium]|nr:glycosyltransferase [Myxococcota bacterium]